MTSPTSRVRLLAAAERILIDEGLKALTLRRLAAASGLNSALVKYYFGSMDGLLAELVRLNLDPMMQCWTDVPHADSTLEQALHDYFSPMWLPAAHCREERALVLVDEIVAHGDPALRDSAVEQLTRPFNRLLDRLAVLLPRIGRDDAAARLRFLSAGALGMPPRSRARQLFPAPADAGQVERVIVFALAVFND